MVGIFYFELIRTVSLSVSLYSYGVPTLYTKAYTNRYQISRASLSIAVERAAPSFSLVYSDIIQSMLGNHRYLSMPLRPRLTEAEEAELDGREWCVETVLPRTAPEVRHLSSKDVATGARAPP